MFIIYILLLKQCEVIYEQVQYISPYIIYYVLEHNMNSMLKMIVYYGEVSSTVLGVPDEQRGGRDGHFNAHLTKLVM